MTRALEPVGVSIAKRLEGVGQQVALTDGSDEVLALFPELNSTGKYHDTETVERSYKRNCVWEATRSS